MNPTLDKFGYPGTLLHETEHWAVLLRPAQATLGSLVLGARSQATRFSELEPAAFADLGEVVARIERVLKQRFDYDKLNYLMLMMVDPNVHFHVLPRYATARQFAGVEFVDSGWPGPPELASATPLDEESFGRLQRDLGDAFQHG